MQEQKDENQKAIDNALFKKLEQLTIKMPSDPILYSTDVDKYLAMFRIEFDKVQGDTMKKSERFGELLIFLARSVKFFPQKLGWIPGAIMKLMEELGPVLHSYIRKKCAGSIMILRAKSILLPVSTTEFLLKQMRLEDKELRSMIYKYVLNDIRRMNSHHQNNKINQQIRAFISGYIPKHTDKTAQKSLKLMIELYKRNIWTDNRSVNIIAEACFAPSSRLRMMGCHFLMETTMPLEELPDSDDQPVNPDDLKPKKGIARQTKARENKMQKQKKKAARRMRKKEILSRNTNFMPIDLIYNPQVFAEKLFNVMSGKNEKYAHKLIYMSLIGRVIWRHQLILLPFYRSLIKYLDPKQKDVSQVLIALAESIHDIVPEDEIQGLIKHIIEHFVNDRCSEFTMTIGLNTLREIFKKMPSIVTEEMMLYLCTYYEYRNKNVSRAAKSVINLVRSYNPMLLERKYRGNDKKSTDNNQDLVAIKKNQGISDRIAGVQLLQNDGNLPMELDRILTDDDFKQIRRLMRKKEAEDDRGNKKDEIEEQSEEDQEGQEEDEGQEGDEEQLQFDSDECEEIEVEDENAQQEGEEQVEGDEEQEDGEEVEIDQQQQGQGEEEDDQDSEEESVIDWQDGEELEFDQAEEQDEEEEEEKQGKKKKKKASKTKQIVKKDKQQKKSSKKSVGKKDQSEQSSEEQDYESDDQDDNHGFIYPNQIAYYKMSKTELKASKNTIKQGKQKFKHTPKEKKGSTTNREKQRLKPLMMIRAKKNKIRSNEKQLKIKIKSLKNQLGKVRSNKDAKKLKNKIIHKTK